MAISLLLPRLLLLLCASNPRVLVHISKHINKAHAEDAIWLLICKESFLSYKLITVWHIYANITKKSLCTHVKEE